MNPEKLRHLSERTVQLLAELREVPASEWWSRGRLLSAPLKTKLMGPSVQQTCERLEAIAATGEPGAIPDLLHFASSSDLRIRKAARSAIQQLFAQLPLEALPWLDESLRHYRFAYADWLGVNPAELWKLAGPGNADQLFIAFATCHRSGYIRAEALHLLAEAPPSLRIPFLLVRLTDWVEPVRVRAVEHLRPILIAENARIFVDNLGLQRQLRRKSRANPEVFDAIDKLLTRPDSASALVEGLTSPSREVRRRSFQLALANPGIPAQGLIQRGFDDPDVIVRRWAFEAAKTQEDFDGPELLRIALRDPFTPIRRLAFEYVAAKDSPTLAEFRPFLADRAGGIRRDCQSQILERFDDAPDRLYREALGDPDRSLDVLLIGLAETGGVGDAALIAAQLNNESARIRRAALRALRMLNCVPDFRRQHLEILGSDLPTVATEAAFSLLKSGAVPPEAIWEAAQTNPDTRARLSVLRVLRLSRKWSQLAIYLNAALSRDEEVSELAETHLRHFHLNQAFTMPSADDVRAIQGLLRDAEGNLDPDLIEEFRTHLRDVIS